MLILHPPMLIAIGVAVEDGILMAMLLEAVEGDMAMVEDGIDIDIDMLIVASAFWRECGSFKDSYGGENEVMRKKKRIA
jgi:hypothetical protein